MAVKTVQATVNGQTVTLTLSDSGKYEGTLTAPASSSFKQSGGYYPVTVKATDDAGNVTTVDATHETLGGVPAAGCKRKGRSGHCRNSTDRRCASD